VGEGGAAGSREPFVSTGAGKWFPAVVWQKSWRERTLPVVPRQIPSSPPPYSRTDHLPFGGCAVELSNVCLTRSPVASLNASFDRSADNAPSALRGRGERERLIVIYWSVNVAYGTPKPLIAPGSRGLRRLQLLHAALTNEPVVKETFVETGLRLRASLRDWDEPWVGVSSCRGDFSPARDKG